MAIASQEVGMRGIKERRGTRRIIVPLSQIDSIAHKIEPLIRTDGINASSAEGRFSRPFGRDFAETASQLHEAHRISKNGFMDRIVPATLNMITWIGKEDIPEAGIEKGKMFHEKGTIAQGYPKDWYVNEQGIGENYDTADATDLAVISVYELSLDYPYIVDYAMPYLKSMAEWIVRNTSEYGGAAYVGAKFDPRRRYKGLVNHNWKDNEFSYVNEKGEIPKHPIYPVREQGFRYASLLMLSEMLKDFDPKLSKTAESLARHHKIWFNDKFPYQDNGGVFLADALDGAMRPITTTKSCDAIAVLSTRFCIIDDFELRREIIKRSYKDLYDERIGLKTVSPDSLIHLRNIYHGPEAAWPHAQGFAIQGILREIERLGGKYLDLCEEYDEIAIQIAKASLRPTFYYKSPVEIVKLASDEPYERYIEYDMEGDIIGSGCDTQAWTGSENEYASNVLRSRGIKEIEVFAPRAA